MKAVAELQIPVSPVALRPPRRGTSIRLVSHSLAKIAPEDRALVGTEDAAEEIARQQSHQVVGLGDDGAAIEEGILREVLVAEILLDHSGRTAVRAHDHAAGESPR